MKFFVRLFALIVVCSTARAQAFKPGDVIEYKAYGKWEQGVIESELPGGRQFLVRRKPSEFYPKGETIAYSPDELRRPSAPTPPTPVAPTPPPAPPAPTGKVESARPAPKLPAAPPVTAHGLLSKEQVIAYAREAMGGDPWGNPQRDAVLNRIRDHIKARGTSFSADADFTARMNQQGTLSSHIGWAVDLHWGPAPKVSDYVGQWALTAANRGSHSKSTGGDGTVKITTTDSQAKSGVLEIKADRTYVWKLGPNDPPDKWLRGAWSETRPEDMNPWEAGPALWLEKAKQGHRYMVRMGRDPAWPGWIDVGAGAARTPVEFGKKQ